MGRKRKLGSGLRNENTFGGMKTDCVLSKIIGTSRFAAIFQIIEKQYFEKLATRKSMDKAEVAPEKLLTSNLYH
jgi:hypothetical protein